MKVRAKAQLAGAADERWEAKWKPSERKTAQCPRVNEEEALVL